jgi:hypothetical protein
VRRETAALSWDGWNARERCCWRTVGIDVSLLSPVALASTLEIPLVTTNRDLADLVVGLVTVTLLLRQPRPNMSSRLREVAPALFASAL